MAIAEQQSRRQHPRTMVSWPVVVEAGTSRYACQAMDISAHGAKVRTKVRLKTGTSVRLEFVPPEGPPLRVGALVWRVDADGLAFLFARGIQHRFIRAA
jgi:PilZ domain-containing protein